MYKIFTLVALTSIQLIAYGQTENDSTTFPTSSMAPVTDSVQTPSPSPQLKPRIYKLKPGVDIPITAIGTGWSLFAFSKIYSKDRSDVETILALDKNNIPKFDRHGAEVYNPRASDHADMVFYSSMPMPVLLMLDRKIRKDAPKIALLYLEAMSVTGLLYTGAVYTNDRFRPYAYNPNVPMAERQRGGAKNSFFAGHVALVGTSTFFMAKVFHDYHPHSNITWLPFTIAGIATVSTGYLRYRGGQHFKSDIILGTIVGTLSGILVPAAHKNKNLEERRMVFTSSFMGDTPQFGVVYKLMK